MSLRRRERASGFLSSQGERHDHERYVILLCACHLVSADSYMNFQLSSAEEWIDGALSGKLGDILIRCNNVTYISEAPQQGGVQRARARARALMQT